MTVWMIIWIIMDLTNSIMERNDGLNLSSNSTGISTFDKWDIPSLIEVIETEDSIELVYKETSGLTYTIYPPIPPEDRVFKIVFSCKDGKWHKSERIYGKIVPSTKESYTF